MGLAEEFLKAPWGQHSPTVVTHCTQRCDCENIWAKEIFWERAHGSRAAGSTMASAFNPQIRAMNTALIQFCLNARTHKCDMEGPQGAGPEGMGTWTSPKLK